MNSKESMKYFSAVTYDNKTYHFIIDNNKIYCCEFGLEYAADIIELKPNFVLRDEKYQTIYSLREYLNEVPKKIKELDYRVIFSEPPKIDEHEKPQKDLIQSYIIEPETFNYMLQNKMLMYSHDMALLYGFDCQHAHDRHFQTRAYKRRPVKVLLKQKRGIFH